jgi:hypothetical protein
MTKRQKQMALGGGVLAVLIGGIVWLSASGCQVDKEVTQPYQERSLATDEIKDMLKSADFKQRLEASKQIDQLPPQERLGVLLELTSDPDAATRLLAVKKLKTLTDPRAKSRLAELATDDPDQTVRELAASGT